MGRVFDEIMADGIRDPFLERAICPKALSKATPVLVCDNVSQYLREISREEQTSGTSSLENWAPPWPVFFMEYKLDERRHGYLVQAIENDDGWVLKLTGFEGVRSQDPMTIQPALPRLGIAKDGTRNYWDDEIQYWPGCEPGKLALPARILAPQKKARKRIALTLPHRLAEYDADMARCNANILGSIQEIAEQARFWECLDMVVYGFTLTLAHCKNVTIEEVKPSVKQARRARKRGKPLHRHHVLSIEPMKQVIRSATKGEKSDVTQALHICRGHFKTYSDNKPLLGRHTGTYWWGQHLRGLSSQGIVTKDYQMDLSKGKEANA